MDQAFVTKLKFIGLTAFLTIFLFVFYAVPSTFTVNLFPIQNIRILQDELLDPNTNYSVLMIWAAASVVTMALCGIITAYAVSKMLLLGEWVRTYAVTSVVILSVVATVILATGGNRIADTAIAPQCAFQAEEPTLCDLKLPERFLENSPTAEQIVEQRKDDLKLKAYEFWPRFRSDPSFSSGIIILKYYLNFFIQIAAIAILSLIITLAAARRFYSFVDTKMIREAYLVAAVVLSLVILTDALFFDFVKGLVNDPAKSVYVDYQKGLLFFYAIISTGTLALALVICSVLGGVKLNLAADEKEVETLAESGWLSKATKFIANPGFGTALATIAPLLTAIIVPVSTGGAGS